MLGWFRKTFQGFDPLASPQIPAVAAYTPGCARGPSRSSESRQASRTGRPKHPCGASSWRSVTRAPPRLSLPWPMGRRAFTLSSGGGVIGGHDHESVREANAFLLATANQLHQHLVPVPSVPVPETGHAHFYALTDCAEVGGGQEDDLGHGRHVLSPLFHAGHGVLTQLRLVSGG